MISAVRAGSNSGLQGIYEKAEACSRELLSDFRKLIQTIELLSREQVRIFE